MRIYWTLSDSLYFLKEEIERIEQMLKKEKQDWRKDELREVLNDRFQAGLEMIKMAKPGEISQELIDFFLDRTKEWPDLVKLKELVRKGQELEKRQGKEEDALTSHQTHLPNFDI